MGGKDCGTWWPLVCEVWSAEEFLERKNGHKGDSQQHIVEYTENTEALMVVLTISGHLEYVLPLD